MLLFKLERGFEAQALVRSDEVIGMPDKISGLLQVLQGIKPHSVDVFVFDGSVDSLTVGIFEGVFGHAGTDIMVTQDFQKSFLDVLFSGIRVKNEVIRGG